MKEEEKTMIKVEDDASEAHVAVECDCKQSSHSTTVLKGTALALLLGGAFCAAWLLC